MKAKLWIIAACLMSVFPVIAGEPEIKGCSYVVHASPFATNNVLMATTDTTVTSPVTGCRESTWQFGASQTVALNCEYFHSSTGPAEPLFVGIYVFRSRDNYDHGVSGSDGWSNPIYHSSFTGLTAGASCDAASLSFSVNEMGEYRIVVRACDDSLCTFGGPGGAGYDINSDHISEPGVGNSVETRTTGFIEFHGDVEDPLEIISDSTTYYPGEVVHLSVLSRNLTAKQLVGIASQFKVNVTRVNETWLTNLPVTTENGGRYGLWIKLPTNTAIGPYVAHVRRETNQGVEFDAVAFRVRTNETGEMGHGLPKAMSVPIALLAVMAGGVALAFVSKTNPIAPFSGMLAQVIGIWMTWNSATSTLGNEYTTFFIIVFSAVFIALGFKMLGDKITQTNTSEN